MLTTKNDRRGEQDAGQVARDQVRLGRAREVGREPSARAPAAPTVIAYWEKLKATFCSGLRPQRVGEQVGERRARAAPASGPAASIAASAKRGRGRDLALGAAREHLQRDELAAEGEERRTSAPPG